MVADSRLLDGLLDLPRHQDGRAPDGRDPAARTASTGCWSTRPPTGAAATRSRPAKIGEAMLAAGFTDDDVDRVLWRNPVEFYGQSGRLVDPDLADDGSSAERRRRGDLRGQLDPARRAGLTMRLRHPDGTVVHLGYCTNVHPAEDVDGARSPSSTRYARPVRQHLGTDRARPRAVAARRRGAPPRRRPRRRRPGCGTRLDEHGLEVVTLNAFPYARLPGRGRQEARLPPDWTEPARLDYTLDVARVLGRPAARRRRPRQHLDPAARPGARPWLADRQSHAAAAPRTGSPTGWPRSRPRPGAPIRVGLRARARLRHRDHRRGGRAARRGRPRADRRLPGPLPPRRRLRGRRRRARPARAAGLAGRQGAGRPPRSSSTTRPTRTPAPRWRRTPRTASCTRCASASGQRLASRDDLPDALDGRRPLDDRLAVAGALPRAAARRPRAAAAQQPPTTCAPSWPRCSAATPPAPTTSRSRPTPGPCCPTARPPTTTPWPPGIAAELAWVRDELVGLGLTPLD